MGMPVRIVLHAPHDTAARHAARAAFARIAQLEDIFSDYRPTSETRRLDARAGHWVPVSEPLFELLTRALTIARLTDGAFDPTVGPLTALWREARKAGQLPESIALDSARQRVGWQLVRIDSAQRAVRLLRPGMRLDLGAIAKGYILQQALMTLHQHGSHAALLEAGGDITVGTAPANHTGWAIDVADAHPSFTARAASLTNAALATSGPSYQYLELDGLRYSHVIDPRTGQALTAPHIARVIAGDAALADALATALGVLGPSGKARLEGQFPGVFFSVSSR